MHVAGWGLSWGLRVSQSTLGDEISTELQEKHILPTTHLRPRVWITSSDLLCHRAELLCSLCAWDSRGPGAGLELAGPHTSSLLHLSVYGREITILPRPWEDEGRWWRISGTSIKGREEVLAQDEVRECGGVGRDGKEEEKEEERRE